MAGYWSAAEMIQILVDRGVYSDERPLSDSSESR